MLKFVVSRWLSSSLSRVQLSRTSRLRRQEQSTARVYSTQPLETRVLPAVFTVNTTLDTVDATPGDGFAIDANGNTSLRAAVMEANALAGDDTITLPAGTYTLTISPTSEAMTAAEGDLDIGPSSNITLNGAGRDTTIINGSGLDRVFDLNSTAAIFLTNTTLTNGRATTGGAIRSAGFVSARDSAFTQSLATSLGGAIHTAGGFLQVFNSNFMQNRAEVPTAGISSGGAVAAFSTNVLIQGGEIRNNSATLDGGGVLFVNSSSTLQNVIVSGNSAKNGGGAMIAGGSSSLIGDNFDGNTATSTGGGVGINGSIVDMSRVLFQSQQLI